MRKKKKSMAYYKNYLYLKKKLNIIKIIDIWKKNVRQIMKIIYIEKKVWEIMKITYNWKLKICEILKFIFGKMYGRWYKLLIFEKKVLEIIKNYCYLKKKYGRLWKLLLWKVYWYSFKTLSTNLFYNLLRIFKHFCHRLASIYRHELISCTV